LGSDYDTEDEVIAIVSGILPNIISLLKSFQSMNVSCLVNYLKINFAIHNEVNAGAFISKS